MNHFLATPNIYPRLRNVKPNELTRRPLNYWLFGRSPIIFHPMKSPAASPVDKPANQIGRVMSFHGDSARIYWENKILNASISGKLKHREKDFSLIAVGDYVEIKARSDNTATVEKVLPRKKIIGRPAVEKEGRVQILVSNIDRLVIISSTTRPQFSPGLIDRFLITAFRENLHPAIVVNKIDLLSPSGLNDYFSAWEKIGCQIIFTSAATSHGIGQFADLLADSTSVLAGHSGVGKSSLLNCLDPELKLKTKMLSARSLKGVHTTTSATLLHLPRNTFVADTPGLRVISLMQVTRKNLHHYFPEFSTVSSQCQFSNCTHINEPHCAVKNSLESHQSAIHKFRYESYLRIYESLPVKEKFYNLSK